MLYYTGSLPTGDLSKPRYCSAMLMVHSDLNILPHWKMVAKFECYFAWIHLVNNLSLLRAGCPNQPQNSLGKTQAFTDCPFGSRELGSPWRLL